MSYTPAQRDWKNYGKRVYHYQAERFPVLKTAILVAAFSSSSILMSAAMSQRHPPHISTFIGAFIITLMFFFQLRVLDEIKDHDTDQQFRPERPIPRGLVSLTEIKTLGTISALGSLALSLWLFPYATVFIGIVWIWMLAMTLEFGVPKWLHKHPMVYMFSHMLIMPAIDLFITATEWRAYNPWPTDHVFNGLMYFLCLSFTNGCIIEVGRKMWAPENERPGVDTYSKQYGIGHVTTLWLFCILWAGWASMHVMLHEPHAKYGIIPILLLYAPALILGVRYALNPTPRQQRHIDAASGIWVLLTYLIIGYVPYIHFFTH